MNEINKELDKFYNFNIEGLIEFKPKIKAICSETTFVSNELICGNE